MATMINGRITNGPIATVSKSGEYERPESLFRNFPFKSEIAPDRFHLYVSYACPWAHRTLIVRNLKKLEAIVPMSITDNILGNNGWTLSNMKDPRLLADLYVASDKYYTGRITVPVLWDKKNKTIVNNESSEIIRIFNSLFDDITDSTIDLYPEHLKVLIDDINEKIYNNVNNGVYRAGFATTQKAYNEAFDLLFATLEELEAILSRQKFLTGNYFTEADIRLFTTLIRFDLVYYSHFKCNLKRVVDYKNLFSYMKCIYQMPEVKPTCYLEEIKEHYYKSHKWLNPTGIVPKGPYLDLDSAHDRGDIKFWYKHH